MTRDHPRRAFTLIELLLVIAIIAILASLLAPTLGRARSAATVTACRSNLHQISLGIMVYSEDNNGRIPGPSERAVAWMADRDLPVGTSIHGLPSEVLCVLPSALVPSYTQVEVFLCPGAKPEAVATGLPSYFYHPALFECPVSIARAADPSALVLVHDHPFPTVRHDDVGCAVFADGHTETGDLRSGRVWAREWRNALNGTPCAGTVTAQ